MIKWTIGSHTSRYIVANNNITVGIMTGRDQKQVWVRSHGWFFFFFNCSEVVNKNPYMLTRIKFIPFWCRLIIGQIYPCMSFASSSEILLALNLNKVHHDFSHNLSGWAQWCWEVRTHCPRQDITTIFFSPNKLKNFVKEGKQLNNLSVCLALA